MGESSIDKATMEPPVGNIIDTIRIDLGDKYLPCDGKVIDKEKYPKLWDIAINSTPGDMSTYTDIYNSGSDTVLSGGQSQIFYSNGYYVFGEVNSTSKIGYIYYSTNLTGPYTKKEIFTQNGSPNDDTQNRLFFCNGYFMFLEHPAVSTYEFTIIYSPSPTETFTKVKIILPRPIAYMRDILYDKGRYCFIYSESSGVYHCAWSTILSGTWKYGGINTQNVGQFFCFDGKYLYYSRSISDISIFRLDIETENTVTVVRKTTNSYASIGIWKINNVLYCGFSLTQQSITAAEIWSGIGDGDIGETYLVEYMSGGNGRYSYYNRLFYTGEYFCLFSQYKENPIIYSKIFNSEWKYGVTSNGLHSPFIVNNYLLNGLNNRQVSVGDRRVSAYVNDLSQKVTPVVKQTGYNKCYIKGK